jgi:regulator of protease activity HflC (stomatin/prohibitin superfamily)
VLLQFGRVVQADVQPGLHVKVPYVNQVRKFDARLMTLDAPTQRFLTLEKKAVMVDAYAKWRVKDAERSTPRPPASSRLPTSACRVVWNRACVTSSVNAPARGGVR